MTNRNRIWVLGAPDPEMEAIESLLRNCGELIAYACNKKGERVTPATAHRGASVSYMTDAERVENWYLVECTVPVPDKASVQRIDHHRPGDHGYGRPPAEFLAASSIGQVISVLLAAYYRQRPPRALVG